MNIKQLKQSTAIIIVCFSGGKDSIAMVLWLLEQGIPKHRIHLHHHDVDGDGEILFDWACTKSYCIAFAKAFGLKLFFSYRKGGIVRSMYRTNEPLQNVYFQREPDGIFHVAESNPLAIGTRRKFPAVAASLSTRWCSSEVKIDVLKRAITNNPDYSNDLFILTGERRQESTNRSKYAEVEEHATYSLKRHAIQWRIILDWTEEMVWDIMKRWGVQPHPAYMLGWNRCSCQLCIFNDPNIWATIGAISPAKVDRIEAIENEFDHTLYHKERIRERVLRGCVLDTLDPYWVEQGTGEFTAPLLIAPQEWVLPSGAFKGHSSGAL